MYCAEICPPTDLLTLAGALGAERAQSAFTSPYWLGPLIDTLAPEAGAEAFGVVVRRRADNAVAAVLPLAATRENGFKTVRFADFGVTDYAAPLIGAAFPKAATDGPAFNAAIKAALSRYDLVRFERLLPQVATEANPLATDPAAVPSRMRGHVISLGGSVRDHVAALGRKVRKEVERCERHIASAGALTLNRAAGGAEVAAAFERLETLQSARWSGTERRYRLDQPAYGRFYRSVIERGTGPGFADVFTLFSGDVPVGAVFGVRGPDRFIVLRIASDDTQWGRFSPGRMTLLAVLEHLVADGLSTFDLGIGDYDFKRRLGAVPAPLADLTAPLSWTGLPLAAGLRTKAFLGRQPALKRLADRVRGRV